MLHNEIITRYNLAASGPLQFFLSCFDCARSFCFIPLSSPADRIRPQLLLLLISINTQGPINEWATRNSLLTELELIAMH